MSKKVWKQMAAALLAASVAASLSGCTKDGTQGNQSANEGNQSGKVSANEGTQGSQSGKESTNEGTQSNQSGKESAENKEISGKFSYFGPLWSPYQEKTPIFDELMSRTGVTVDFEWTDQNSLDTLLASKVASKDLPDVISGGSVAPSTINDLISQGLIVPISDYLDNELANYGKLLTEQDRLFLTDIEDGKIYGFGLVMDVKPAHSTMIRTDWLKRVNKNMPSTWDEWMDVWKAFKEQDANGNGNPDDEVPFGFNYSMMKYMLGVFGMKSNGDFSIENGEYLYDPENPKYEKYLDSMRELYTSGLISQEMVTLKGADFNTLGASNTLGSLIGYAEYAKNYSVSCRELDKEAFYQCVVPIIGPTGEQNMLARAKVAGSAFITKKAVENGNLGSVLKFFNYVYSEEGITLTNYGVEGTNHSVENNKPVLKAPYNESFKVAREKGIIPSTIPFCFTKDCYMQILTNGLSYEKLDDVGKTFMDGMTINDKYYYEEPPVIKTESYVECFDLLEQQKSLRDQYIMGQIDKDAYQQGYKKLQDGGLSRMADDVKQAYAKIAK